MGGSASIESGYITIIDGDTKNVIIKLRNVNLKKITLADCRIKLLEILNGFYFIDANGIRVLQTDELILATEVMKPKCLDLYIKLENTSTNNTNMTSDLISNNEYENNNHNDDNNNNQNYTIEKIFDVASKFDDFEEQIGDVNEQLESRLDQATTVLGGANVENGINAIWGTINNLEPPSKEIQDLLNVALIGIEVTSEFVPGARTFISICADVYQTFKACDELNDEVLDAQGFVIDITKLIIKINESKTFDDNFPKNEVHDCLKRLSTLIIDINNQSKNKFSKWFHARTNIEELQSLKQE